MYTEDGSEIEFFGNNLWGYYDSVISNNFLSFDYYGFDKDNRISAPRFKISISGKTANHDKVTFDTCMLYKFSYQLKGEILKNIKTDIERFKKDQKWSHGFSYNSGRGKNIYVTIMWNDLSNSAVIRFMIGEKERTILESDKIYIPIVEFFSFCEILNQAFNNYVQLCSICNLESNIMRLQKITDGISMEAANSVVRDSGIQLPSLSTSLLDQINDVDLKSISGNQTQSEPVLKTEPITDEEIKLANTQAGEESVKNQDDFDSFLKENRDKYELDLPETSENLKEKRDPGLKNELETKGSKFIEGFCQNDFLNLEQIVFNASNEILPFDAFVKSFRDSTGIDFSDGIDSHDYTAVNYVISDNIKYHINQLLEKKVKLPSSITPIIVKNNKKDNDKIDAMYYLLMFYIYLSKIRVILSEKTNNALDNKEYFSYVIKTISNPLVFSYLPDISEGVIKTEVIKRYTKLIETGFFNKFVDGLKNKLKINNLKIDTKDFEESISKIYESVIKFRDKLGVQSSFNGKLMKVTYRMICDYDITLDVLKKIIHFDNSFIKYGKIDDKVDLKSYDDVPVPILKLYGIKDIKFDNTILVKYFKDNIKNFTDLEKIKRINKNVYDIIDDIDISMYDVNALRALYYWNVDVLPRDLTYFAFKNMIDSSSLERNELVSMILNRTLNIDKNFYNSFLISATDGSIV